MSIRRIVCAALLGLVAVVPGLAQTTDEGRPRLKEFGSSLKRLKWDAKLKQAVEQPEVGNRTGPSDDEVVKVNTDLVTFEFQITDARGNIVKALTRDDFIISEDGEPQKVDHFSLGSDQNVPRTIVLLIDYSVSQHPYLKTSVEAAKTLVDQLGPRDLMAIVTTMLSCSWISPATR
jgi:hypothetical protein